MTAAKIWKNPNQMFMPTNFVYFSYAGSLFENMIFWTVKKTDLAVAMDVKKKLWKFSDLENSFLKKVLQRKQVLMRMPRGLNASAQV